MSSGFQIYNASAGSGKTFTLVKQYLTLILASENTHYFKHLLALTFTNKAVNEMKSRILNTLKEFADIDSSKQSNTMFSMLVEELEMKPETLRSKSQLILETILHNYAAFDISTIDKFNHRLIRTFAHDLKIPGNFEVELDQDSLLEQAVDNLILKTGEQEAFTKLLVDFSLEKADDDKSWDIGYDFKKIAKFLVNENDLKHIEDLKENSLEDFKVLKTHLKTKIKALELKITEESESALRLIDESGLQFDDFSGGYLPKHFLNLSHKKFDINFEAKWQENLDSRTLYPKRVTSDIAEVVEAIQPSLVSHYNSTKTNVFNLKFLMAIVKTVTPLSVLTAINTELNTIKEEDNKLLISEFNSIISNEIKDQPTPFIYERLGEKYRHYFIDEFQDTSKLQWQNLQPLVSNALEQEAYGSSGSLLLVGDAKQAIYRWRGGYAEQFIALYNKTVFPFSVEQQLHQLTTNYRSSATIVNFNNDFFKFLASRVFSNEVYAQLFQEAHQDIYHEEDGFVCLEFLDINKDDDKYSIYTNAVYKRVLDCLDQGYKKTEIAILVRRKAEGLAISEYLSEKGIPILSSETLLLKNSKHVRFLNEALTFIIKPDDKEAKIALLQFISETKGIEYPHQFFKQFIDLEQHVFFSELKQYGFSVDSNKLKTFALYDLVESLVRTFIDLDSVDAYVQSYLDEVFNFSEKNSSDIAGFLDFFKRKENDLAIASSEQLDAIRVMTIHKSKGLEFPVVIFPFAEQDIYREKEATEWFPLDKNEFKGFNKTLLNYTKDFKNFGTQGEQIHLMHRAELELDNINLLYVTLTRAEQQLFVISKLDVDKKGEPKSTTYSGNLIAFLKDKDRWNANELEYTFGRKNRKEQSDTQTIKTEFQDKFISNPISAHNINIVTRSGLLWDTSQEVAIEKGNLIHDLMSLIKTTSDIDFALNRYLETGKINTEQYVVLERTVRELCAHPKLRDYFKENCIVYNETDILTSNGEYIRPDRLVLTPENTAILIDYKTGNTNTKHKKQLETYEEVIEQMGLKVIKKILVYINAEITVKEV